MTHIYKYTTTERGLMMPKGAKIIKVGLQHGKLTFWAEVDPEQEEVSLDARILGTGYAVPEGYEYTDTVFDDPFVWHVYIKIDPLKKINALDREQQIEELLRGLNAEDIKEAAAHMGRKSQSAFELPHKDDDDHGTFILST